MKAFGSGFLVVALAAALLLATGILQWNPTTSADRPSSRGPGPARLRAVHLQSPDRPGSAVFPPAEAEAVGRAVKSAQRSLNFQTELPGPVAVRQQRASPSASFISDEMARVLLWLAIALAVGAIIWSMRGMWGRTADLELPVEAPDDGDSAAAIARMGQGLAGADDLARGGDFVGALHMLLLHSLSELRGRLNAAIAVSLTSREIWAATFLPPEGKKAFADIVGRVEISWFGHHRPGSEDYLACRRSFEILASILKASPKSGDRPAKNGQPATDSPGPAFIAPPACGEGEA